MNCATTIEIWGPQASSISRIKFPESRGGHTGLKDCCIWARIAGGVPLIITARYITIGCAWQHTSLILTASGRNYEGGPAELDNCDINCDSGATTAAARIIYCDAQS